MINEQNIKNREAALMKILRFVQDGGAFDKAKQMFKQELGDVDVAEITAAERELIAQGLNPADIQALCNVHAAIFKGNIQNTDESPDFSIPGHPVYTFRQENMVINSLINDALLPDLKKWQQDGKNTKILNRIRKELNDLKKIDYHYKRKENSWFMILDKYGITAPPRVMWGVDENIRNLIYGAIDAVNADPLPDKYVIEAKIEKAAHEVLEMIFKEEAIMIPILDEVATPRDWHLVKQDETEVGYTLINTPLPWYPTDKELKQKSNNSIAKKLNEQAMNFAKAMGNVDTETEPLTGDPSYTAYDGNEGPQIELGKITDATINLAIGSLNLKELQGILDVLPIDLTFVDNKDRVKWFSNTDRIFPRTRSVIGRPVVKCHPPKSIDKVQHILSEFRAGVADKRDFWVDFHDRKIYLAFYAVRDDQDNYLGCLEVTQDITFFRQLKSQKTLENQEEFEVSRKS